MLRGLGRGGVDACGTFVARRVHEACWWLAPACLSSMLRGGCGHAPMATAAICCGTCLLQNPLLHAPRFQTARHGGSCTSTPASGGSGHATRTTLLPCPQAHPPRASGPHCRQGTALKSRPTKPPNASSSAPHPASSYSAHTLVGRPAQLPSPRPPRRAGGRGRRVVGGGKGGRTGVPCFGERSACGTGGVVGEWDEGWGGALRRG